MTKYKISTLLASAAFLGSAALFPAFASNGTNISGNGAFSDSEARLQSYRELALRQLNVTDIANRVITSQNTGGNTASFNTGSNVTINTGNANSNVDVQNQAGKNVADVSGCATCANGNSNVGILGNGAFSDNNVRSNNNSNTMLGQLNLSDINTNVGTVQNTGNNNASFNTGSTVRINTGDTNSNVDVRNAAGTNVANVAGSNGGSGSNNGNDVTISGNGAFSNNAVRLNDGNNRFYGQDNRDSYKNDYGHNNYDMRYNPSTRYSLDKNYFDGNNKHDSYNKDNDHHMKDYNSYDNNHASYYPSFNRFSNYNNFGKDKFVKYDNRHQSYQKNAYSNNYPKFAYFPVVLSSYHQKYDKNFFKNVEYNHNRSSEHAKFPYKLRNYDGSNCN